MPDARPALWSRDDTFLGVCEGLGRDFRIDPLWLRVAFALALFFQPAGVVGAYLALGVAVAVARWAFPDEAAVGLEAEEVRTGGAPALSGDDGGAPELAMAA